MVASAGLVAVGAFGLAACGGGSSSTSAGAGAAETASYIPAGSPIYLEASTDLSSSQWQTALDVAHRFPGYQKLIDEAKASLAKEGKDFERDIRPLLGDSAALAVTDLGDVGSAKASAGSGATGTDSSSDRGRAGSPPVIVVIRIAAGKEAEVQKLLLESATGSVTQAGTFEGATIYKDSANNDMQWATVTDGAVVIASTEGGLKSSITARKSGNSLAKNAKLSSAFADLPSEVIVQGFVDVGAITNLARARGGEAVTKQLQATGLGPDSALAASLTAEQQGLRVKAVAIKVGNAATQSPAFTPTLTKQVPANALMYLGMANLFETGRRTLEPAMAQDPKVKSGAQQARGALALVGVSVDDLKTLFGGESAVVVTPGSQQMPGVSAILGTEDGGKAQAILDRVREKVVALSGGKIPAFSPVSLANNVKGWESKIDPKASLVYGVDGNNAFVGSSADAVRQVQAPTSTLVDDAAYKAATAQMPAKVSSVMWLNGELLWNTIEAAGGFKNAPPEALANLRPLRNLAAWSTQGDTPTVEAFLTVK